MARKKFYIEKPEVESSENYQVKVAKYMRLSRMDGDNLESDSISNQRRLLNNYILENDEFLYSDEFIDDDWTGTNFQRPSFQRMLKEIQKGNINCIIIKDLSRFGRNYIEAGKYLEEILPKYNCRIVSIIDDIDTEKDKNSITGLMVRIKNLIHDNNSRETSIKVRHIHDMLRLQGKNISPAPFGYIKDPSDKYKLIIDEEAAIVVQMIFDMYISGIGTIRIANKLNELGIVTRIEYRKTKSLYKQEGFCYSQNGWRPDAISAILSNKTYKGSLDQKRSTTRNYKDREKICLQEKDHIIVDNTHEPIITPDVFEKIQTIKNTRCVKTSRNRIKLYPLSGVLKCADCGSPLIRNQTTKRGKLYVYYKCRTYNQQGCKFCNHSHSIKEESVLAILSITLNSQIRTLINLKKIVLEINKTKQIQRMSIDYDRLIRQKQIRKETLKSTKLDAYMDWKSGDITKEDYLYMCKKFNTNESKLEIEITSLQAEKQIEQDIRNNDFLWLETLINHGTLNKLTNEIIISFVEKIEVKKDKDIKIIFKYQNQFDRLANYVQNHAYKLTVAGGA